MMAYNLTVTNRADIPLMSQMCFSRMPMSQSKDVSGLMMPNSQHLSTTSHPSHRQETIINKTCPCGFPVNNQKVKPGLRVTQVSTYCENEEIPTLIDSSGHQCHANHAKESDSLDFSLPDLPEFNDIGDERLSNVSRNDTKETSSQLTRISMFHKRPVRFIGPGCSRLCKRRCKENISQRMREDIFKEYWSIDGEIKKRDFIANNAKKMPMQRCVKNSRRRHSIEWAFTINGESYSVCKLFFLDTLDIPTHVAYEAMAASEFCSDKKPVIVDRRDKEQRVQKSSWFETDLDKYTTPYNKNNSSKTGEDISYPKRKQLFDLRPCCVSCRQNCHSKLSKEDSQHIFNEYRGLVNIHKQKEYIAKCVKKTDQRRGRGLATEWYLCLRGEYIRVCRTFFLHTVNISDRAVYDNMFINRSIQPAASRRKQSHTFKALVALHKSAASITAKRKLKSALKLSRACRKHCQSKFTFKERLSILKEYQGFDLRQKRVFISRCVIKIQCQTTSQGQSRRVSSVYWFLPLNGYYIKVCKNFFLHTIDVSEKNVYSLWDSDNIYL